jgi:hypothetical protein
MSDRPHYGSPTAARLNQLEDELEEARAERDRFATLASEAHTENQRLVTERDEWIGATAIACQAKDETLAEKQRLRDALGTAVNETLLWHPRTDVERAAYKKTRDALAAVREENE